MQKNITKSRILLILFVYLTSVISIKQNITKIESNFGI